MRPILLSGHERSLTQVKYNREGDLLFSCSKDHIINVWFTHNGERLGTYNGHNGTVWSVDVDSKSEFMVSGSADNSMRLWKVSTGECLKAWEFPTAVKRVAWSEDDNKIALVTEQRMGHQGAVRVFEINREGGPQPDEPLLVFNPIGSKAQVVAFSPLDQHLITGHENGKVALWDVNTGEEVASKEKNHIGLITDLQMSADRTYFLTSSKDKSARLYDSRTLEVIKSYQDPQTPLNSAALIPGKPYLLVGGGQEAMAVTTTSARQGHFEIRMWHVVFEEEVSRIKGGFGPCNSIAVHPEGKGYAIGGEDGYIRLHHFDDGTFRAKRKDHKLLFPLLFTPIISRSLMTWLC
ncbi:hypothetical protein PtB15_6B173 [Puccinia triticina]|nr:hypothetical protein PtB15_6B173 [Puccinia triticina]